MFLGESREVTELLVNTKRNSQFQALAKQRKDKKIGQDIRHAPGSYCP